MKNNIIKKAKQNIIIRLDNNSPRQLIIYASYNGGIIKEYVQQFLNGNEYDSNAVNQLLNKFTKTIESLSSEDLKSIIFYDSYLSWNKLLKTD